MNSTTAANHSVTLPRAVRSNAAELFMPRETAIGNAK
jgi:hypothetical protein